MSADPTTVPTVQTRPAFDFFEGFLVTNVIAALEIVGAMEELATDGVDVFSGPRNGQDAALLEASLRYLVHRGVVEEDSNRYVLTELGAEVRRDAGYLLWLSGGYGEPLHHLDEFLAGTKRYGREHPRDGRWVAGGTAVLARQDVVPYAMDLLDEIEFDRILDLGCGNARFLIAACQRFGCEGIGVDINPAACEQAANALTETGMEERVRVLRGDVMDLDGTPLPESQVICAFFMLHEIASMGRETLLSFLSSLASRLPSGGHLLIGEVGPPVARGVSDERFTPEFTFIHALMRQSLLFEEQWRDVLAEAGFPVRKVVRSNQPGGMLLLARRAE